MFLGTSLAHDHSKTTFFSPHEKEYFGNNGVLKG